MTHKENITAILECYFTGFKKEIIDSACNRILEQEPILDKIKAEIMELDNINPDYPMDRTIHISRNEVLQIIDKYKTESEE